MQAVLREWIFLDSEAKKSMFMSLVIFIEMSRLHRIPHFKKLQDEVAACLTLHDIFTLAYTAARTNNVALLKLLKEDFGYHDLAQWADGHNATVLHEACLHGAGECIKYLLSLGADPNARNSAEETPLHCLVRYPNQQSCISLFKPYKVNPNLHDNKDLAPIHVAAVLQYLPYIAELKKLGANLQHKFKGKTYLELAKSAKEGRLTLVFTQRSESRPTQQELANAEYHRGILLPKLNQQIFQDVLKTKLESSAILQVDARMIIDCYLLGYSIEPDSIKKFLNKHLATKKLTFSWAIKMCLRSADLFIAVKDAKRAEGIVNVALSILEDKHADVNSEQSADFYNDLTLILNKSGYFIKATEVAEKGLLLLGNSDNKKLKAYLYYNLALSHYNRMMKQQKFEYLQKAFNLLSDDPDIFSSYYVCLIERNDFQGMHHLDAMTHNNVASLTTLHTQLLEKKLSTEELLKATDTHRKHDPKAESESIYDSFSEIYRLDLECNAYFFEGDYPNALASAKRSFELCQESNIHNLFADHGHMIMKRLKTFVECKEYLPALEFLNECEVNYPIEMSSNLYIKCLAVTVYIENQRDEKVEQLLNDLQQVPTMDQKVLRSLYVNYALNIQLKTGGFEKALSYFMLAQKIDPTDLLIELYILLLDILKKAKSRENQVVAQSHEVQHSEVGVDESSEEKYDPAQIHAYFQAQKQKMVAVVCNSFFPQFQQKSNWIIDDISYSEDKLVSLNSLFYPDHYASIHPNLALDAVTRSRFEQALSKGVCKRQSKQNGIKFLDNKLIELKIDDDIRLYTTTKYKNNQGEFVIVFDKVADHQTIKRLLQQVNSLSIIEVKATSSKSQETGNRVTFFQPVPALQEIAFVNAQHGLAATS